jgi:phosphatidylglycerophosphate synthase
MAKQKEKFWTIPNILSLSRIPLSLISVLLLLDKQFMLAIITLVVMALTDFFDGYFARRMGQITKTGEMLDQLSDKLSVLAILLTLFFALKIPPYVLLILTRDLIVVIFASFFYIKKKFRGLIIKPSMYGKTVTALQFVTLILIFVKPEITMSLVIIILIITLAALVDYYFKFIEAIKKLS